MATYISPLAYVDPRAQLGEDVHIGPFCYIGPNVVLGNHCRLDSHVTIIGWSTVGERNRFLQNCVIGGEPQDKGYIEGAPTQVIIGDDNQFREGVTVNRGALKEDGVTRIGSRNLLMTNCHIAHNCYVHDDTTLVNGVLLGGHVHIHDRAIVSGNAAVHHFGSVGRLAFVAGCSKVVTDVPPFMIFDGNDDGRLRTLNLVGMQRAGISAETITILKRAFRLLIREHRSLNEVQAVMTEELAGTLPAELSELFSFLDYQRKGRMGRGREVVRGQVPDIAVPQREAA